MFRSKSVIKITKVKVDSILIGAWRIQMGKRRVFAKMGISRLLRLLSTYVEDKDKVQSIEIVVKRKR